MNRRFCTLLPVLLLTPIVAWAEVTPEATPTEDEEGPDPAEVVRHSCRDERDRPAAWLDRAHSYVSERLCEPAAWFDGFFGDARADEETPIGSFFRVRNSLKYSENDDFSNNLRVSANLTLPRVSDRIRLLVSRDESIEGDLDQDESRSGEDEEQTRLGLRYLLSREGRTQFDIDGTVRISGGGLNPQARGRGRHTWPLTEETQARFTQTVFWERRDGFGTSSRADWEWLPSREAMVRLTGRATIAEDIDGIDWRTSLVGFRQLDRKTAIRSEIGAAGRTKPQRQPQEYFLNFRFRRAFLRDWLFYELQPEVAWPLDDDGSRYSDLRFTFTLEIQFENAAAMDDDIDHYRGR
jgi:hypothetical protein